MPNVISNFLGSEVGSALKLDEKQQIGIAGFYMMAIVRQGYTKSSQIPFTPLENGSYATDHIIQMPLMIDIEGSVADIYEAPSPAQLAYMRALGEIGNVDRYLPARTRQQINAINSLLLDVTNQVNKIDDLINTGEQLFNLFSTNSSAKGLPEQFIDLINSLIDNDQIIQIELPYKVYDNMAISNFSINYPNEYSNALDFRMTAWQIRYANTIVQDASSYYKNPAPAVKDQIAPPDDKGINKTKDVPASFLSEGWSAFKKLTG